MTFEGKPCKTWIIAAAGMLLLGASIQAQAPASVRQPLGPVTTQSTENPAPTWSSTHALTADDLAAFMDGLVPEQLAREDIAGAVVLVLKDGKILFAKGYGYADIEKKTPMTPDRTLVRPGSISKLFTWTAVMQQVEQGKIDLDRDVNDYLDFKIPARYSKPITMRNLMTHTAGFEESVKDLIVHGEANHLTISEYVRTHIPQRVYPPGTTPAYSNYGATLAGYIVERVSGTSFDMYIEQNVFGPLAMTDSSFRQPLPANLQPLMSMGYPMASEPAKPFEIVGPTPAGSSSISAEDMSHFMLAHLQQGEWNGVRILKPETVQLMHSAQFAVDPVLSHMCLGFYEETRNGHRIIGHAGDLNYFHSDMHLIQDANVGLFVSYNSRGRGEVSSRTTLFHDFLDRYFPYAIPPAQPQPSAAADAKQVAGSYISSRRAMTNLLSFFWMLGEEKVTPGKDGTLITEGMKGEDQVAKKWDEIGPLLYREKNGQDRIGFTKDSEGRTVMSMDFPFEVSTKVSLLDSKILNMFLMIFVASVSLLTLVCWPFAAWSRKHYRHPLALTSSQARLRLAIRGIVFIDLLYICCWAAILAGGEPLFDSSYDVRLRLIQMIGWLGSLGTLVVLYAVWKTWRSPGEWRLSHLGNILIVLSALFFSWFLFHWHLLHFSLVY